MEEKTEIIVATSGGFDPVHVGHIRLFKEAKSLGDKLIVILNNDNWIIKKKKYPFMKQEERKEIIEALECVDEVIISSHSKNPEDMSVCKELEEIRPDIFANGGDRDEKSTPSPEIILCEKIGCKPVFNVGHGGKVQSSSWLIDKYLKQKVSE